MKLTKVFLQHFRAFAQLEVALDEVTLLAGGNGAGKTSVIEAIHVLSRGDSFRAGKVDEMVAFDQELARVGGRLVEGAGKTDGLTGEGENEEADVLEVTLTRGMVGGARAQKRLYAINGAGKRRQSFVGQFLSVVFRPEDMRLIEGSPGRRRAFVDSVLSLTSADYAHSLRTYDQALRRYNRFIDQVRDGKQPRSVLTYWEMLMIKHGEILQTARADFFEFLRAVQSPFSFDVRYHASLISQASVDSHRDRAIAAGHALIGPHKDDFSVLFPGEELENRELSAYGSRGQQRLGVLWLKIGELHFLEQQKSQRPILLLDDIFSELDEKLEAMVLELVGAYQTVMTTANKETQKFLEKKVKDLVVVEL